MFISILNPLLEKVEQNKNKSYKNNLHKKVGQYKNKLHKK
jgi:hypothetical protein